MALDAKRHTGQHGAMNLPTSRWYFIDALRILALALLVPYHVGMYYVSWGWHVKSPHGVPQLEALMMASNPWRMSLLFLLAGTALGLMLAAKRGQPGWWRLRLRRLGWPLLFGMLVVVPPQPYFEVREKLAYAGSYLDFLHLYFSAYGGFCREGCLVLPTWNHLWFLAYLLAYTALLALLLWRWPQLTQRAALRLAALWQVLRVPAPLASGLLLLLPIGFLMLTRVALRQRFPTTHALVDDWYMHSQYLALFALGLLAAHWPLLWRRMDALRWLALALAILAWGAVVAAPPGRGAMGMLVMSTLQWCAIVAACGFAHRHLNHETHWRRTLTEAMLPLYLLHQTVIIVAAMALRPLQLAAIVEGPLLIVLAFAVSGVIYVGARQVAWLRPLLGLPALAQARILSESA
jgi:glucans biosynthesis protein C